MAASVWFPRAREVEFRDETIGAPGAGEVRIRAIASGLSQGTEMLVFRGEVPADLALDLPTLAGSYGFPIKYGYASVGRVVAVGAGVAEARNFGVDDCHGIPSEIMPRPPVDYPIGFGTKCRQGYLPQTAKSLVPPGPGSLRTRTRGVSPEPRLLQWRAPPPRP